MTRDTGSDVTPLHPVSSAGRQAGRWKVVRPRLSACVSHSIMNAARQSFVVVCLLAWMLLDPPRGCIFNDGRKARPAP